MPATEIDHSVASIEADHAAMQGLVRSYAAGARNSHGDDLRLLVGLKALIRINLVREQYHWMALGLSRISMLSHQESHDVAVRMLDNLISATSDEQQSREQRVGSLMLILGALEAEDQELDAAVAQRQIDEASATPEASAQQFVPRLDHGVQIA